MRPGSTVGIRNRLPADRERRGVGEIETVTVIDKSQTQIKLGQYGIGRFLLSKREANRDISLLDNRIVDVQSNLVRMNRHRGTAIDLGKIMLMYQTPSQFSERVLGIAESNRKSGHLTPRGKREYLRDMKESVANTFRRQFAEEAAHVEDQMRQEDQMLRMQEMQARERLPSYEGISLDEWIEEYDEIILGLEKHGSDGLARNGANANTGASRNGFKFTSNIHFSGEFVGLKVRYLEDNTAAEVYNDLDRINQNFRENGLINGKYRELDIDDIPLFLPLFETTSAELADELYLPHVTREAVHFQELGIHKIQ